MSVPLKLANVWRVLRDVDLDAIRTAAESPCVLVLAADDLGDARGVATLLAEGADQRGGAASLLPWTPVGEQHSPPPEASVAVLITRGSSLSEGLTAAREAFDAAGTTIATVVLDADGPVAPENGEAARIAAPGLDSRVGRDLVEAIVRAAGPDRRLALARQLPAVRERVIDAIVEETAQANASYAFASGLAEVVPILTAPLNVGDIVVLTKNQLVMSYRIALATGLPGNPRELVPEIAGVLGGGFLLRQMARQLVGLVPVIGLLPKVAIAYGGTYAVGRAIAAWARDGRAVSAEALQRLSREGLARGREIARGMGARRRERRVEQAFGAIRTSSDPVAGAAVEGAAGPRRLPS